MSGFRERLKKKAGNFCQGEHDSALFGRRSTVEYARERANIIHIFSRRCTISNSLHLSFSSPEWEKMRSSYEGYESLQDIHKSMQYMRRDPATHTIFLHRSCYAFVWFCWSQKIPLAPVCLKRTALQSLTGKEDKIGMTTW